MNHANLEYYLNNVDWLAQSTTADTIASLLFEIEKSFQINPEKNKNLNKQFLNKLSFLKENLPRKYNAIIKAYRSIVDKHTKELSTIYDENLVKHNLAILKSYLKKDELETLTELINSSDIAFTISAYFNFFTNPMSSQILNNAEFKKTNNNTRDRKSLIRKLEELKFDKTIILEKTKEYDEKWTLDKYLKLCQDTIFETLIEVDGIGQDRAKRISSKIKKAIKNYHTK